MNSLSTIHVMAYTDHLLLEYQMLNSKVFCFVFLLSTCKHFFFLFAVMLLFLTVLLHVSIASVAITEMLSTPVLPTTT